MGRRDGGNGGRNFRGACEGLWKGKRIIAIL